jgi:glutamate synthase domain-containing protein 2
MCNTNNCPAGIATQRPELTRRLDVDMASERLARFLGASVALMKVLARACAHDSLSAFNRKDLTSWKKDVAELAGIRWAGPEQSS